MSVLIKTLSPSLTSRNEKILSCLLGVAIILAYCVILLGAYTRLKDAGLGCPDWPGCYGQLTAPSSHVEIDAANAAFPQLPVNVAKARTEMTHRYFAESLGALIVLITLFATFQRPSLIPPGLGFLLVGLVIFQGMLGMWTVTMGLFPLTVVGHLLGGFSTLTLLWLCWLYLRKKSFPVLNLPTWVKNLSISTLIFVLVQIFLGGWTSANYAALICLDFPTCQGQWWPAMDFTQAFHLWGPMEPNNPTSFMDATSRITIQMMHRLGALAVFILGSLLAWSLWRHAKFSMVPALMRRWSLWLQLLLLLQVGLGITNILAFLPLPVAVAHNGIAALLLLTCASLTFFLVTEAKRV